MMKGFSKDPRFGTESGLSIRYKSIWTLRGIQRELRRQRPCYVNNVYTGSEMPEKPSFASQYGNEQVEFVRQTCLYVATKLGDLLHDSNLSLMKRKLRKHLKS